MAMLDHPPTDSASTRERVKALVEERLNVVVDDPSTDLFATGQLDSLGLVTLLQSLESEFGVGISADDFEVDDFRSVDAITAFLDRHAGGDGA